MTDGLGCQGCCGTGDEAFDRLLKGGLPARRLSSIIGDTGSGKSVLAHQFAQASGEGALYCLAGSLPAEAAAALTNGAGLRHVEVSETLFTAGPQAAVAAIAGAMDDHQPSLVVIDAVDALAVASDRPAEFAVALLDFNRLLWRHGACGLALVSGLPNDLLPLVLQASAVVIELDVGGEGPARRLQVTKHEGALLDSSAASYEITDAGLRLLSREYGAVDDGQCQRLLSAFRTCRQATAEELAELLCLGLAEVQLGLGSLELAGHLNRDVSADGKVLFVRT